MAHERGAALLITLVLITVIGSIAFGVGRSTLTNFRLITRLEDSLNAYQAAQAGIEDGLLRFRFSKNSEVPTNCPSSNPKLPTTATTWFSRVNVTTGVVSCVDLDPEFPLIESPGPTDIVYDLKMHFKKDPGVSECLSTSVSPGCVSLPSGQPALAKDTSIEYNVNGLTSLRITTTFDPQETTPTGQRKLEVIMLSADGSAIDRELYDAPGGLIVNQPLQLSGKNIETIRLRAFGRDVHRYEIQPAANESLDSRITVIESTGYFGVSKRKLRLEFDRLSGTAFELFDFVLYAGSSGIVGPTP